MLILGILVFGFFVGWLAQMVLGMGAHLNARALIAGLAGSFVGGTIGSLLGHEEFRIRPSGLIGSFVGAIIVLAIWRAVDKESFAK